MTDWISANGGRLRAPHDVEFDTADPARQVLENTVAIPLVHLGAVDVIGADAERFLQGQTSAQLSLVDGHFAPLTAFCSPKGRVMANAQLMRVAPEHYRLILHSSLVEPLTLQLSKFAAFYKVSLEPQENIALIGLIGREATALTEVDCDLTPPKLWHQATCGDTSVLTYPGPQTRYLITLPTQMAGEFFQRLLSQCVAVGNAIWKLADIQAGLHFINADQQDAYLPQMLNWEALAGISFKKGCYTGQEVVARAHFRGQVKKRLFRVQIEGDECPDNGSEVVNESGKRVGEIIASQVDAYGQPEGLAVLSTQATEEPLSLNGHRVQLLKLPYALERLDPEDLADSADTTTQADSKTKQV
ncbi:YgfZ/GcvT domain-containing protein [Halomonas binhaiensis]|uniref:Folate-binding protein YgfZ n=1 Tax=Halomonas binhaiensis TaxID=2562282 RepID=A0A5C1NI12_9GAMM|nr:folate-binding protein YgfZ [Halomonas binhaiensis]QEM81877.1 folate-binding protein YgfZ [Halomonas binhaiensis]